MVLSFLVCCISFSLSAMNLVERQDRDQHCFSKQDIFYLPIVAYNDKQSIGCIFQEHPVVAKKILPKKKLLGNSIEILVSLPCEVARLVVSNMFNHHEKATECFLKTPLFYAFYRCHEDKKLSEISKLSLGRLFCMSAMNKEKLHTLYAQSAFASFYFNKPVVSLELYKEIGEFILFDDENEDAQEEIVLDVHYKYCSRDEDFSFSTYLRHCLFLFTPCIYAYGARIALSNLACFYDNSYCESNPSLDLTLLGVSTIAFCLRAYMGRTLPETLQVKKESN